MVDGQVRTTDVTEPAAARRHAGRAARSLRAGRARKALAYIDEDILISGERGQGARYLMKPSPFAKLVQLAEIRPGDTVLDVGAGTGYSAAVLSRLAGSVVALESDAALAEQAASTLAGLGYDNVVGRRRRRCRQAMPRPAPYDVIFVEGAVEELPEALLEQLKRRRPPGRGRRAAAMPALRASI